MINSSKSMLQTMPMSADMKKQMANLLNHPDTVQLVAVSVKSIPFLLMYA